MRKKYTVQLTDEERQHLQAMTRKGAAPARQITRAHILLQADQGTPHAEIARALRISEGTVTNTCRAFQTQRTDAVYRKRPDRVYPRKLDGVAEAYLIALACSTPLEGRARWTLRLLAQQLVELEVVETVSYETVRQTLKKTRSSRP